MKAFAGRRLVLFLVRDLKLVLFRILYLLQL